ncbi:MAG: GAF domain-containing protein, partial [Betaproteobacteria bacterium]
MLITDLATPIDDSAAPIRDSAGVMIGVVMVFRGVTEQRRAEQHRNVRLAVTDVLNQAANVQDTISDVLRVVCEHLAWDAGIFWTSNAEGDCLACRASWHRPNLPVAEFETASRRLQFKSGEGLPGRVWASRKSAWIPDVSKDADFLRLASATANGLKSAFACPVVIGDRPLGVIEFY